MDTDIQTLTQRKCDHMLKSEKRRVRTIMKTFKDVGYDCMAMYLKHITVLIQETSSSIKT